ncbi:DUF2149 domain-containing protein [Planctomycetes bacterium TBK1r]|uniref:DUF2149 domain-containing protein n=1 Tax=Stieleria magnilauensis TaxID=2527963 RepID=A0ABX5Y109_9BACT|nr:hypothetical protein TBK1r_47800 [Planctomycetes bacterium TBK1r]
MRCKSNTSAKAYRRLLGSEDDDPLSGIANLFDISLVFVVALLIALMAPNSASVIQPDGEPLTKYSVSEESLGGEGERLGMAYRLKTGEVIYVPEHPNN